MTWDWSDPRRRRQALLAGALVLGVLLLVASHWQERNTPAAPHPSPDLTAATVPAGASDPLEPMASRLAAKLEDILSDVQGAGRVRVEVHLERGPRWEYASNQVATERRTSEQDAGGGRRTTTEQRDERQLLTGGDHNGPLISEIQAVEIAGVLVVAEGAVHPGVRAALAQAVATYLHMPAHRVMVLAGDRNQMRRAQP